MRALSVPSHAASAPVGGARPRGGLRAAGWILAILMAGSAAADDLGADDDAGDDITASRDRASQEGPASWYGGFFHGRLTASGEVYDQDGLTAAHRWLPLGSRITVTNLENGCSVTLRVTDRGPYHGDRILDCSRAAAIELGFLEDGVTRVRWDLVAWPTRERRRLRIGQGVSVPQPARPLLRRPEPHEVPAIAFEH